METSKLLTELQQRDVNLTVDGDNLRYVAPKGALTDDLRQAISYHKAELIERLRLDETIPKAASTDSHAVSEPKRKALPSSLRLQYAYQWLCSFDMAFRVKERCTPETTCSFLVDWLPDLKRKEFLLRGDLSWLDWNSCYALLKKEGEPHDSSSSNSPGV